MPTYHRGTEVTTRYRLGAEYPAAYQFGSQVLGGMAPTPTTPTLDSIWAEAQTECINGIDVTFGPLSGDHIFNINGDTGTLHRQFGETGTTAPYPGRIRTGGSSRPWQLRFNRTGGIAWSTWVGQPGGQCIYLVCLHNAVLSYFCCYAEDDGGGDAGGRGWASSRGGGFWNGETGNPERRDDTTQEWVIPHLMFPGTDYRAGTPITLVATQLQSTIETNMPNLLTNGIRCMVFLRDGSDWKPLGEP